MSPPQPRDEFEDFYLANYGDAVALVYAFSGDLGEAQDVAQEAFCRAWQRWAAVAAYENPVAWVRRVAINLATSGWRRRRVADRFWRRERPTDVPGVDPSHVAVVAALRTLPDPQQRALVMHYLLDLPVVDVAHEMGVPPGTVKSWLHRGRAALAVHLSEAAEEVTERG